MAKERKVGKIIAATIGILLCVIFGLMLICNLTIIIKGVMDPENPATIFGVAPMIVKSGSMSHTDARDIDGKPVTKFFDDRHIEVGDLIFVKATKVQDLKVGDIIAFKRIKTTKEDFEVITHRILEITKDDQGEVLYITKGDWNNSADDLGVKPGDVIGLYQSRIAKLGNVVFFIQEPLGMALFIGLPLCAFIVYDIIRRTRLTNKASAQKADMQAEIDRLRAMVEKDQSEQSDNE